MASILLSVSKWSHKIILLIGKISLIAMVIIVTMTVVLRYVFNTGIGWAEEVPRLLVTLFAFIAMAMGTRDRGHITVDFIYNAFRKKPKIQKGFLLMGDFIVFLCGAFMLYYGGSRCLQMMKLPGVLPMTGWPTWIQYAPVPLSGFIIALDSLLFMTGMRDRSDYLYTEPEIDYVEEMHKQREEEANA